MPVRSGTTGRVPILENMDELPFVTPVYKRDLEHRELLHRLSEASLHVALYRAAAASRAAPSACGRRRSAAIATARAASATSSTRSAGPRRRFPQVKEFFFDDDTFTDDRPRSRSDRPRARQARRHLVVQRQGQRAAATRSRSCATTACGLLLVGYESGNQQILHNIKKGHAHRRGAALHQGLPRPRHHHPRHLHPRPARRDPRDHRRRPSTSPPRSIRTPSRCRSPRPIPAPSFIVKRSSTAGSITEHAELVDESGVQIAPLHYPHLTHTEIFQSVDEFYRRFYFRAPKIAVDRLGDGAQSGDDDAAAARRRRILLLPARTPGVRALNQLIITADDFGLSEPVNAAVEEAHRRGILSADKPHGRRRPQPRTRSNAPAACRSCGSGCTSSSSMARR